MSSLDECFLDLKNNRHLHYGNRTHRPDYNRSKDLHMIRNVHNASNIEYVI